MIDIFAIVLRYSTPDELREMGRQVVEEQMRRQTVVRPTCPRPPAGWVCTRGQHPDGTPCAAIPKVP